VREKVFFEEEVNGGADSVNNDDLFPAMFVIFVNCTSVFLRKTFHKTQHCEH
jgi:hypothetical protein